VNAAKDDHEEFPRQVPTGSPVAGGRYVRLEGDAAVAGAPTPMYQLDPSGPPAVPTGKILVRLPEGTNIESRRSDLERAGYELERSHPYAPNAGWVRPRDGKISTGLRNVEALMKLPGVEHVEPQMLMERANKKE